MMDVCIHLIHKLILVKSGVVLHVDGGHMSR